VESGEWRVVADLPITLHSPFSILNSITLSTIHRTAPAPRPRLPARRTIPTFAGMSTDTEKTSEKGAAGETAPETENATAPAGGKAAKTETAPVETAPAGTETPPTDTGADRALAGRLAQLERKLAQMEAENAALTLRKKWFDMAAREGLAAHPALVEKWMPATEAEFPAEVKAMREFVEGFAKAAAAPPQAGNRPIHGAAGIPRKNEPTASAKAALEGFKKANERKRAS